MHAHNRWTPTRLFAAALAFSLMIVVPQAAPPKAEQPDREALWFDVLRDGEPIGHHSVGFRRVGDELHVDIEIALAVNFGFITVFRYEHTNREIWRDGQLMAIETSTNDNGERHWLKGEARDAGFVVESSAGSYVAPTTIVPTSYWNMSLVEQDQLLDTQSGRLIAVDVAAAGDETIVLAGQPVDTRRYDLSGELDATLWYTAAGAWAQFRFDGRGDDIVYRLRTVDDSG